MWNMQKKRVKPHERNVYPDISILHDLFIKRVFSSELRESIFAFFSITSLQSGLPLLCVRVFMFCARFSSRIFINFFFI